VYVLIEDRCLRQQGSFNRPWPDWEISPEGQKRAGTLFTFYLQTNDFLSGAEGIRTPDIRRAKADVMSSSYLMKDERKQDEVL
jgi:hypothetical protein